MRMQPITYFIDLDQLNLDRARLESLTAREHEVMEMVCAGKANKVIAMDLNLSQRTVEIHRARVMEKMHAKSLAHLVQVMLDITRFEGSVRIESAVQPLHTH